MNIRTMIFLLLIGILTFSNPIDSVGVLSIDLGTEFIKIAVVAPGIPMDVVLNLESKRKTPAVIAFNDNERLFGSSALNLATRRPEFVYERLPSLIGKHIDHPIVKQYRQRYPYHNLSYNETSGQLNFKHPNGMVFTVQELIAMILENAQDLAERHSSISLQSCILTVPSFFNQAERRWLIESAKLAGLEVLQLMNSNTAVALNFGVFRRDLFNATPQHIMFFDVGSASTTATVVTFQVGKHRDGGNLVDGPILTVIGVGSEPALGTFDFIEILRNYMADQFNLKKRSKGDVKESSKAMAKLTKEASRVFTVLSANAETIAQVESLFEDEDFQLKVTRSQLNELCAEKFEQLEKPFTAALRQSKLDQSVIQDIVLMGGGTRVPKVQALLMHLGKRSELGKSVNSDEAAVLGAAYQGAAYAPGIRVLPFAVKDYNPYPIGVDFSRASSALPENSDQSEETGDEPQRVRRVLFPLGNQFPQKRAITFNRHTDDLTFFVNYVDVDSEQMSYLGSLNHSTVTTKGVLESIQRYPNAEMRGVKAHFSLDLSGVLTLTGIDCLFHPLSLNTTDETEKDESTLQKLGNKISGFFGSGSKKPNAINETDTTQQSNNSDTTDSNSTNPASTNTTQSNQTASDDTNKSNSSTKPPAPFSDRIDFVLTYLDSVALSVNDFAVSREKLHNFRMADQMRQQLERAMNELESTLFSTRDQLQSPDFIRHSTDGERTKLNALVSASLTWYDDQDRNTPIEQFEEKLGELRELLLPIEYRLNEARTRPAAFKALTKTLTEANLFLHQMRSSVTLFEQMAKVQTENASESEKNNETEEASTTLGNMSNLWTNPVFSMTDVDALDKLIRDTQAWMNASEASLAEASPTDRPPILVADVREKHDTLARELLYQTRRLARWRAEVDKMISEQAAAASASAKASEQKTENKTPDAPKESINKEAEAESNSPPTSEAETAQSEGDSSSDATHTVREDL